jgi:NitT/TauT family transport system ATP-binding protein
MLEVCIDRKAYLSESGAERTVLSDVRFSVEPGEVVGLLGPSGAGKSTLLRILLGLDKAYEGHVHHDFRRVGVVFQEPRLLPWMTVEENIRLVVTHDMKPPDIRFLLETVQLGHAAALRPRQLSLGMARRVALARALAISPELLVLDEPFASLDARLGAALAESVAHWAYSTGAAVIVATHDLAQAMQRVSRLLILSGVPARLCADRLVPAAGDRALYAKLLAEFPFLCADQRGSTDPPQLPSVQTSG